MQARFILLIALWMGGSILPARAEDHGTAPEQVIRAFYRWYVQELLQDHDPFDPFASGRAELKRYATERLIRQINRVRKSPDGLDGDYFVDAQDFDKDWAKNIIVAPVPTEGERASTVVELKGKEMSRKLRVGLVRQGGDWKIDKVEGLE